MNFLAALTFAWLCWVGANFAALALSALLRPQYPCFNGFRVVIPSHLHTLLSQAEVAAVVAHEEGHRRHLHVWENFAKVCVFLTPTAARRFQQELEADDHAIAAGHAHALASALAKLSTTPADRQRAERVLLIAASRNSA